MLYPFYVFPPLFFLVSFPGTVVRPGSPSETIVTGFLPSSLQASFFSDDEVPFARHIGPFSLPPRREFRTLPGPPRPLSLFLFCEYHGVSESPRFPCIDARAGFDLYFLSPTSFVHMLFFLPLHLPLTGGPTTTTHFFGC